MYPVDVISLTSKLISFNTVNPPGNEKAIAEFVGEILAFNGFQTDYIVYGENRLHLIAEKGVTVGIPPVVFLGHFDTVPVAAKRWNTDPFSAVVRDGKIYGRGSSDMKGALAAMMQASILAFHEGEPRGGVRLIFTSDEETGCRGVQHLASTSEKMGNAAAIVVGEPTANVPYIGHKGALYLNVSFSGTTAHSSMPELGDNAIYKAARAVSKIEKFRFSVENDSLLGYPTINVGKMSGGMNLNSVPDHAEFTIDVRSTKNLDHPDFLNRLQQELGEEACIEILLDMDPVITNENDPFVWLVYEACSFNSSIGGFPKALPYLTDGSVLQRYYKGVPTVILGPGQPGMAHQTDEYCFTEKIIQSVDIYKNILLKS